MHLKRILGLTFGCIALNVGLIGVASAQVLEAWVARYHGPVGFDNAQALDVDAAGNVYVTGTSDGPGTGWDFATLKYDPDGNQLWEQRYNGPANGIDEPRALKVDSAGNVYVTGESVGAGAAVDYITLKYDTDGNLLWEQRYNGPTNGVDGARACCRRCRQRLRDREVILRLRHTQIRPGRHVALGTAL